MALTSVYGERINPVLNTAELHNGVDLAAAVGTPVVAVSDGVVTETGVSPTYGKYVKYDVGGGYALFYAHLSEVLVQEGAALLCGQTVALTGDTGLVTGAHLHCSVFYNGTAIDPLPLDFLALS